MNTRRRLLIAIGSGALAAPFASFSQQPARSARIGFLGLPAASDWTAKIEALRSGLRELGYVEGKNLAFEFRWAEGKYERLPALAEDLIRLKVDVIVTHATTGVRAAKQATATIPIVIAATGDAVATGLVASLARPGGNATGSSFFTPQLAAKRLELIKEALPRTRRVAVLFNSSAPRSPSLDAMALAAKSLKLELQDPGCEARTNSRALLRSSRNGASMPWRSTRTRRWSAMPGESSRRPRSSVSRRSVSRRSRRPAD